MFCAERLHQTQIECMPAVDLIRRFNDPNVLNYADPPYPTSTKMPRQYAYEMSDIDHEQQLRVLLMHKGPVMISGYKNEMDKDYLAGWTKVTLKTTAERGLARMEALWMNFETQLRLL
jgi:Site-specific DNA methylase